MIKVGFKRTLKSEYDWHLINSFFGLTKLTNKKYFK